MKNSVIIFSIFALSMNAISCAKEEVLELPDQALQAEQMLMQANAHHKVILKDQSPVISYATGETIPGAFSKLWRREDGISAVIHSSALEPKGVYTVWMGVFENPEYCTGNICDFDDILDSDGNFLVNPDGTFGTPGVNISLLWVDGKVASAAGVGTFTFKIKENHLPGELLFGPGLTDALGSEIHFALRNHGQVIPGKLEEQLTTYGGGCEINQCSEEQFAIHLAE